MADPPSDHPAIQLRNYYCDIYTGQTIVCLEFETLDSLLSVVSNYIIPAQMIAVYSYKSNPYNYGRETIYSKTLEEDLDFVASSSLLPFSGKTFNQKYALFRKTRKRSHDYIR